MCARAHVSHEDVCARARVWARIARAQRWIDTHTHTHIRTHTYSHTHTHTRTHTRALGPPVAAATTIQAAPPPPPPPACGCVWVCVRVCGCACCVHTFDFARPRFPEASSMLWSSMLGSARWRRMCVRNSLCLRAGHTHPHPHLCLPPSLLQHHPSHRLRVRACGWGG